MGIYPLADLLALDSTPLAALPAVSLTIVVLVVHLPRREWMAVGEVKLHNVGPGGWHHALCIATLSTHVLVLSAHICIWILPLVCLFANVSHDDEFPIIPMLRGPLPVRWLCCPPDSSQVPEVKASCCAHVRLGHATLPPSSGLILRHVSYSRCSLDFVFLC